MATEGKRVVMLKRVVDPSDPDPQNPTSYVDVPVIVNISFDDPGGSGGSGGGKFVRTFDSTANNTARMTHVHTVQNQSQDSGGNITSDDGNTLSVERIDQIAVRNGDQKEFVKLSNNDPPPLGPGDDPALGHLKTHVVRYNQDNMNDPDALPWIDVELVDQIKLDGFLKQRKTRAGQLFTYFLQNDPGSALNDASDPYNPTFSDIAFWGAGLGMLPLDTNGNPDPVRLDPFQNIVNVSWNQLLSWSVSVGVSCHTARNLGMVGDASCSTGSLGLTASADVSNPDAGNGVTEGDGPGMLDKSISIGLEGAGTPTILGAGSSALYTSRRRTAQEGSSAGWIPFNGANTVTFSITLTVPDTQPDIHGNVFGYENVFASAELSNAYKHPTKKQVDKTAFSAPITMGGGGTITGTVTATLNPPSISVSISA